MFVASGADGNGLAAKKDRNTSLRPACRSIPVFYCTQRWFDARRHTHGGPEVNLSHHQSVPIRHGSHVFLNINQVEGHALVLDSLWMFSTSKPSSNH